VTNMALLWLYGLCAWGAALNCPAWAALAWRRWRDPAREAAWRDGTLLVRAGLTSLSFGTAGLAGVRLTADLLGGTVLAVPSPAAILFIGCMAAAEPMFLAVDDIHARTRGTWSRSWALYWVGAGCWTLYVILAV
jgi:hypothetical protein